jgi:hypothetical protein
MKTLLVTPLSQCSSFWWRTKFQQPQSTIFSRSHYVQSLVLPEVQTGHPQKELNRSRQQVSQTAISKDDRRRASSNGWTTEPNIYMQKGRTFRVTMFHSIHILFITNYNQVSETFRSSHINILLIFSFHCSCWSVDDLPALPITLNGYTSSNFPK